MPDLPNNSGTGPRTNQQTNSTIIVSGGDTQSGNALATPSTFNDRPAGPHTVFGKLAAGVGEALTSFFNPEQTPEKTSATPTNISPEKRPTSATPINISPPEEMPSYLIQQPNTQQRKKRENFAKQVIDNIWNNPIPKASKTPKIAKQIHFSSPPRESAAPPPALTHSQPTPTHIRFESSPPSPPLTITSEETGNPLAEERPRRVTRSLFSSMNAEETTKRIREKTMKEIQKENEATLLSSIKNSGMPSYEQVRIRVIMRAKKDEWRQIHGPPSTMLEATEENTFLTGRVNSEIAKLTGEHARLVSQKKKGKTPRK